MGNALSIKFHEPVLANMKIINWAVTEKIEEMKIQFMNPFKTEKYFH